MPPATNLCLWVNGKNLFVIFKLIKCRVPRKDFMIRKFWALRNCPKTTALVIDINVKKANGK